MIKELKPKQYVLETTAQDNSIMGSRILFEKILANYENRQAGGDVEIVTEIREMIAHLKEF